MVVGDWHTLQRSTLEMSLSFVAFKIRDACMSDSQLRGLLAIPPQAICTSSCKLQAVGAFWD